VIFMKKYFNKCVFLICQYFGWQEAEEVFEKIQIALTMLMQLFFVVALIFALLEKQWTVAFISLLAMFSIWFPLTYIKRKEIYIPVRFEFLLTLFIYASLFLGEIQGFYTKFWWWDIVLHAGSGIALGFIGFLIVYSLYRHGPLRSNPGLIFLFSFSFALSLGALWEIIEFGLDSFWGLEMQFGGLRDTMWDLIVDAIGAFITSLSGYFYVKYNKKGIGIFKYYLIKYLEKNL